MTSYVQWTVNSLKLSTFTLSQFTKIEVPSGRKIICDTQYLKQAHHRAPTLDKQAYFPPFEPHRTVHGFKNFANVGWAILLRGWLHSSLDRYGFTQTANGVFQNLYQYTTRWTFSFWLRVNKCFSFCLSDAFTAEGYKQSSALCTQIHVHTHPLQLKSNDPHDCLGV